MDLIVLNKNLIEESICDVYSSFLWVERYNAYGEFELDIPVTAENLRVFNDGWYLEIGDSDRKMVIEDIQLSTEAGKKPTMKIKGRSPESILERRIVMTQTNLNGSLQDGIEKLLNDNVINPPYSGTGVNPRKIPQFTFKRSKDPRVLALKVEIQITYSNLYDAIQQICAKENLGFRLEFEDDGDLIFELYFGTDRSYDQNDVPYVVFSPNNDNLINSNYLESSKLDRTFVLIGGEGEGTERVLQSIDKNEAVGLNRREMFVDARDISSNKGTDEEIPLAGYKKMLIERGNTHSAEMVSYTIFDGEVETNHMFKYGVDFFMGDIVQLQNEFGITARTRVNEILFTIDDTGRMTVPTFVIA